MTKLNVTIITTCSSRKLHGKVDRLDLRAVHPGDMRAVVDEWHRAVSLSSGDPYPACDVYRGRAFSEAKRAAEIVGGELWIVSAGLGLLRANELIPIYDLSVTGGGENDVREKILGTFIDEDWWSNINREFWGEDKPISKMVIRAPARIYVFALSSKYYRLVEDDLLSIPPMDRKRLRFVGLGMEKVVDKALLPYLLPYDSRFDGPDSPIRGTRSDFAQRAARHFVQELVARGVNGLEEQKKTISRLMEKWHAPMQPGRESMTDEKILAYIRKKAKEAPKCGNSRMLRALRDSGFRCEQNRFKGLYCRATGE